MKKRLLTTLCGVLSVFAMAFADDVNYSGTVVSDEGEPIMGATVTVTGTTVSTITDMDGKFTIVVPDGYSTVTVSYSGMKKQVVSIQREPIMLYASAEKAQQAKLAAATKAIKPQRNFKRNAFNLEFSYGQLGGDLKEYYDKIYRYRDYRTYRNDEVDYNVLSVNLGWKHNFNHYIGWHVLDFGASFYNISDLTINEMLFSAATGVILRTPSFKGLSAFGEVNFGAAYVGIEERVDFMIRPRFGINFGKLAYVAYKYDYIKMTDADSKNLNFDTFTTHNVCIGFNF